MRIFGLVTVMFFLLTGCFGHRKAPKDAASGAEATWSVAGSGATSQKLTVTPADGLVGQVALVSTGGRFVVLNFPVGRLPAIDQHLIIYRKGQRVGEVRVTGPQDDDNLVADLVTGNSEVGDQVREK